MIDAHAVLLADAPASDDAPPTGSGLLINGGAAQTTNYLVWLTLSTTDEGSGVESMRFSNDGTNWSGWDPYATGKWWYLTPGSGTKTVYVEYQDWSGNVSEEASDTIYKKIVHKKKKKKRRRRH